MAMMLELGKISDAGDAFRGFVSGVLLMGGIMTLIFTDASIVLALSLTVIGVVSVLDSIFPYGRQPYLFTFAGGFFAGFVADMAAGYIGASYALFAFAVLALVLILGARILGRHGKSKKAFKT